MSSFRALLRQVSDAELVALSSWPSLAERKPLDAQMCEYWLIEDEYSQHGAGPWLDDSRSPCGGFFFDNARGAFPSDPSRTYWRPAAMEGSVARIVSES
jgi:hypothetical protein